MKIFCLLFLIISQFNLFGQSKNNPIRELYGKVVDMDRRVGHSFDNVAITGYKYYFSIFHFKIVTNYNDTLVIGYVFNLIKDAEIFNKRFGIKKDSIYIFDVSSFYPCNSDFPCFANCSYELEQNGQIMPFEGGIIKQPYSKIDRIICVYPLKKELWEQIISK